MELAKLSGSFGNHSTRMIEELSAEIRNEGSAALIDHLRLCGTMPEQYRHDSSEEKLYSKYTDAIISEAFTFIGMKSAVITARADAADVIGHGSGFSLVADAKAFRLSRTAKNQKDFKIQAMDGWRGEFDYAVVICPIYQLPASVSQIYQQAIARNVCILSYSHLAALVGLTTRRSAKPAEEGLHAILKSVSFLNPSKSAVDYWMRINRSLLDALGGAIELWEIEKIASIEALQSLKEESLQYLRTERVRLLSLTHQQALDELIQRTGLNSRIAQIERIEHGRLLGI